MILPQNPSIFLAAMHILLFAIEQCQQYSRIVSEALIKRIHVPDFLISERNSPHEMNPDCLMIVDIRRIAPSVAKKNDA
jgi:hypothetical protein